MGIPAYHAVLAMADTKRDATLVVKITGSQWKWRYEYPDEHLAFTSNLATPREQLAGSAPTDPDYLLEVDRPLVLPVGEKVRILLTSTDVIHSWWVPAFGVKQDAIPGFLRETWVRIESPGVYRGQCAELCGGEKRRRKDSGGIRRSPEPGRPRRPRPQSLRHQLRRLPPGERPWPPRTDTADRRGRALPP